MLVVLFEIRIVAVSLEIIKFLLFFFLLHTPVMQ